MKNIDKILKQIKKDKGFTVNKTSKRNNTIKITHKKSKEFYIAHDSAPGYHPVRRWYYKKIKETIKEKEND